MTIGEVARLIREEAGFTQRALAKELGVTNIYICNIERGTHTPSWKLCQKYQEVCGYDPYVACWILNNEYSLLPNAYWMDNIAESLQRRLSKKRKRVGV